VLDTNYLCLFFDLRHFRLCSVGKNRLSLDFPGHYISRALGFSSENFVFFTYFITSVVVLVKIALVDVNSKFSMVSIVTGEAFSQELISHWKITVRSYFFIVISLLDCLLLSIKTFSLLGSLEENNSLQRPLFLFFFGWNKVT